MSSLSPMNPRCVSMGLGLLALAIALRWVALGIPAGQGRLRLAFEIVYAERGALLLGLHVAAMTVLTAGVLGTRDAIAVPVCLFWTTAGALLECGQHPLILDPLLELLAHQPPDSILANGVSLYLLNAEFSQAELFAAVAGGWFGLNCIQHQGSE